MTDADLRERYPFIPWDLPLEVSLLHSPDDTHLACRYCIAQLGLQGTQVAQLPRTVAEFAAHLQEKHT